MPKNPPDILAKKICETIYKAMGIFAVLNRYNAFTVVVC